MSWFFGGGKKEPQTFSEFVPLTGTVDGGAVGDGNGKPPNKEMEAYRFDSAALERAANAAKELEKSKFAKEALDLAKMQESTKRTEIEAQIEQLRIDARTRDYEEKRKALHEQAKIDQQKAQYQDQLARKRYDDQMLMQQKFNDDNLKKQEQSVARQEALKKETFEKELEKSTQNHIKKVEAEYNAKGRYERENRGMILENIKLEKEQERETMIKKMREQRETTLESLKSVSGALGYALDSFISNPEKIRNLCLGAISIAAGFYIAKRGSATAFNFLEANLLKPQMVTKTSRITALDFMKHPVKTCRKFKSKPFELLEGVILHPNVDARVRDIAISMKNTKKNKGYLANFTLYGPPGTGKTMFAEQLATTSGMDYAIIAGGDLSIPGEDSVNQLNKLFDWAEASRKGMVLFIDEADSFLFKRDDGASSTEHNKIMSVFLHRTGRMSRKFSIVMATNRPEAFDYAIGSRTNEFVVFPLPTFNERQRLVMKYFQEFILIPSSSGFSRLKMGDFDYKKMCNEVAKLTDGLSGRDIANLANDWQFTAFASADGIFNEKLMMDRTHAAILQHKFRKEWNSEKELKREMFSRALMNHVLQDKFEDITSAVNDKNNENIKTTDDTNVEK